MENKNNFDTRKIIFLLIVILMFTLFLTTNIKAAAPGPPSFTVDPADAPDPVDVGNSVTFTATATDPKSEAWYLAICKTNAATNGAPPTCDGGAYCISTSTTSGSQASCSWTSTGSGAQNWWAFPCDGTEGCGTMVNTNSPITVTAGDDSPTVTLNSPVDYYNTTVTAFTFTGTAVDDFLLQNITLYGDWNGGWHANETNSTPVNATATSFSKIILDGTYLWNYYACDNASQCSFASANRTFTLDTIPPTWSDPSATSAGLGIPVYHNISWSDVNDLSWATLEVNGTGGSCSTTANVTSISLSGTNQFANLSWTIPNTCEGKAIGWKQYTNDSFNLWNETDLQIYSVPNVNPLIEFVAPTEDNDTSFNRQWIYTNVSLTEPNFQNITFTLYNSTGVVNETFRTTESLEINWTGLSNDGILYWYNVSVYDTLSNFNKTELRYLTLISDQPPQSSNYIESPTDSPTYSIGANYQFNTTWTDDNSVSIVFIEHNFTGTLTNYTVSNITTEWYYDYSDLSAGFYSWKMYANDTVNTWNFTNQFNYTVNQNPTACQVLFNETSPATYPATFLVWSNCTTSGTLTRNGTTITNNTEQTLAAGVYNFSFIRDDSSNYSNYYDEEQFIISKATPSGSLTNNETYTETYPQSVTIGLSESNTGDSDVVYEIYRDGANKSSGESVLLGVGVYNYTLNTSGGINYSSSISLNTQLLTINANAGACGVLFNESSPVTYPATFLVYTDCTTSDFTLRRNGTTISNNSVQNSGAGAYNFSVQRTDSVNYSNTYNESQFIVTQASPIISKFLNGAANNETVVYPTGINASAFVDVGNLEIWRNETNITSQNNINETLGVNYYEYKFNVTSTNQNYSNLVGEYLYATVTQNPTACQVLFNETSPATYPATFLVWSNCTSSGILTRNGTTITNNTEQTLAAGAYNFSFIRDDSSNYSNYYDEEQFIISKATGEVATYINEVRNNKSELFNSEKWLNATLITGAGNIELYYNGTLINQGASPLANLTNFTVEGTWNVSSVYNGNINYTLDTEIFWVTVSTDSAPTITIWHPSSINYNTDVTQLNYTATDDIALSACWYSTDEGATNSSADTFCLNFTDSSSEGSNTWNVYANDSINQVGFSTVTFFRDTIYPIFSNHQRNISTPNEDQSIQVNVTITESNINEVIFEWNGTTNYTVSTNISTEYYYTLANGNYTAHDPVTYYWYANDTSGNINKSEQQSFTVANQIPTVSAPALNDTIPTTNEVISCDSGTFSDDDTEDTEQDRFFRWYDDEAFLSAQTSQTLDLSVAGLDKGNVIRCSVSVYDGFDNSTWTNSSNTATIQNSAPAITNSLTTVSWDANGSVFNYDYEFTDADGDSVTWYDNVTLFAINSGNGTISDVPTESETGTYGIIISVSDGAVNSTDEFLYTINDVTPPNIDFASPTEANDSQLTRNFIQVNVTSSDVIALSTIVIRLYNSTGLVQTNISISSPFFVNFTNLADENYYFNATVNDSSNNVNQTETRSLSTDTGAPTINYVSPTEDSGVLRSQDYIEVNVTAGDPNLDNIVIYLYDSGENFVTSATITSSPNFANFTGLADGLYFYNATANDTFSNENSLGIRNITLDTTNPSISSLIEDPNDPATYNVGASYQFNATITDDNLDTILIGFDGANYTPTETGSIYDYIRVDLTVGAHNYFWYANDSMGNVNTTAGTYAVNQNTGACQVLFNESSPVTYPATFLVYTDCTSGFTLRRNGTAISNNSVQNSGVGAYNFSVQRTDSVNYSNTYDESQFIVSQATGNVALLINGTAGNQTGTYGVQTNASASTTQGTITLSRNGTDVTAQNNILVVLAANYYNYTAVSSGNTNYTSVSTALFVDISKAASEVNLSLNGTDGNVTIVQDLFIPLNLTTLTGDSEATLNLYNDGLLINQGTSPISNYTQFSTVGTFNITGFYVESENYTGSFETWYVNVTETPDVENPGVTSLTESPSDSATYNPNNVYGFNATISDNRNIVAVLIDFDGVNYTLTNFTGNIYNFSITGLSVGTYNYRWYANDSAGNLNSSESGSYTINQNTTSLNLVLSPSDSVTYGTETTATGSGCPSQITCTLYRDGSPVSNSETSTLAVGIYNYTYNTTGNTNYTTYTNTSILTINQETGVVFTYVNNSRANLTIEQQTVIYLNGTLETGTGNIQLYRNGTLIESGSSPLNNLSNFSTIYLYNITTFYPGNENYTSAVETFFVNVTELDVISPSVSVLYPGNISYAVTQTQLNYSASDNFGLNQCWYSTNLGVTNISVSCGTNITGLTSNEGSNTWIVYANDAKGNENSSSITFFVDTIDPTINFASPTETSGITLGRNFVRVNITASDLNLDTLTLRLYDSSGLVQTNTSSTSPLFINFTGLSADTYYFNATVNDSTGNEVSTATRNISLVTPNLTIVLPKNHTYFNPLSLRVNFIASYEEVVWYNIGGGANTTISGNALFNTSDGQRTLNLYANNSLGESSKNITFTVNSSKFKIVYTNYSGSTKGSSTNFNQSSFEDIQNLSEIVLENTDYGKIEFNENINLTEDTDLSDNQINLDTYTNISNNFIEINSTDLPNLNKSSSLYLYNLTFTNPRILREGMICPDAICTKESYVGGTLKFNVTQFTSYSSEETPVIVAPPTSPGGGGGGSTNTILECVNDSQCTEANEVCWNNKCVQLFDIKIVEFESPVKLGDFFEFTYFVKGIADISDDVEINFWIERNGEIVSSGSDTIYIGSFEEKIEQTKIFLPSSVESGIYTFYVEVVHDSYTAKSHRTIEILVDDKGVAFISPIKPEKFSAYIMVVFLFMALLIISLIFYIERKRVIQGLIEEGKSIQKYKLTFLISLLILILGSIFYYLNIFGKLSSLFYNFFVSVGKILPLLFSILAVIITLSLLIIFIFILRKRGFFASFNKLLEKRRIEKKFNKKYKEKAKQSKKIFKKKEKRFDFFKWSHGIVKKVSSFFSRMFGFFKPVEKETAIETKKTIEKVEKGLFEFSRFVDDKGKSFVKKAGKAEKQLRGFKVPKIRLPKFKLPKLKFKLPKFKLPKYKNLFKKEKQWLKESDEFLKRKIKGTEREFRGLRVPKFKFKLPKLRIKLPKLKFKLPKFKLPKLRIKLPKFKFPKYKIKNVLKRKFKEDKKKFEKIKTPKLKFKLPKFKLPKLRIKLPKFKFPKYKINKDLFQKEKQWLKKSDIVLRRELREDRKRLKGIKAPKFKLKLPKFKLPRFKIKLPKLRIKAPKFKLLRFKIKINLPKIPKFNLIEQFKESNFAKSSKSIKRREVILRKFVSASKGLNKNKREVYQRRDSVKKSAVNFLNNLFSDLKENISNSSKKGNKQVKKLFNELKKNATTSSKVRDKQMRHYSKEFNSVVRLSKHVFKNTKGALKKSDKVIHSAYSEIRNDMIDLRKNFEDIQKKQKENRLRNRFFGNRFESKGKTAKRLVDEVSREVKDSTKNNEMGDIIEDMVKKEKEKLD